MYNYHVASGIVAWDFFIVQINICHLVTPPLLWQWFFFKCPCLALLSTAGKFVPGEMVLTKLCLHC